jgi:hypothetical protein
MLPRSGYAAAVLGTAQIEAARLFLPHWQLKAENSLIPIRGVYWQVESAYRPDKLRDLSKRVAAIGKSMATPCPSR